MAAYSPECIMESLDALRQLELQYRATRLLPRIRFLSLLKSDPALRLDDVARQLDCSPRTAYRWWGMYVQGGVDGLLRGGREGTAQSHKRLDDNDLLELRQAMIERKVNSPKEVQDWLHRRLGVIYSMRGITNILHNRLRVKRDWVFEAQAGEELPPRGSADLAGRLLDLLNAFPVDQTSIDAALVLKQGLERLFSDVDRVSVAINIECELNGDPKESDNFMASVQYLNAADGEREDLAVFTHTTSSPFKGMLNDFQRLGYPVHEYHTPLGYEYYHHEAAYLGVIMLWRLKGKPEISERTRALMMQLEPFFLFVLTDAVVRRRYNAPVSGSIHAAFRNLTLQFNLTRQEYIVILRRLYGESYKEIAGALRITENTTKKLLQSVYQKTGTRGHIELFAKYFGPLAEKEP